ncbi:MAG: hypothetical protein OXN97_14110 [Bryobacterales bacterium]|nr:hypothetical protein [Bryobacterales bacterium]
MKPNRKPTKAEHKAQDWRKDMQGATPEQLAKALLRPIGRGKAEDNSDHGRSR